MGKDKKRHDRDLEYDSEVERREKKKAQKKVEKVAKVLGYSNDINPFGDANLLQPFVWGKRQEAVKEKKPKKEKKDKKKKRDRRSRSSSSSSSSSEESEQETEEAKRLKLMAEIDKVRKRRQDRETELAEIDRLRDEEQRLKEMAAFGDWQRKEEDFLLEQAPERSRIRLTEFREKPIDLIVKNILLMDTARKLLDAMEVKRMTTDEYKKSCILMSLEVELRPPTEIIDQLYDDELEGILNDIIQYEQLDLKKDKKHEAFWKSIFTVVKARKRRLGSYSTVQLHQSIVADVEDLLHGKSIDELDALEADIKSNLAPGKSLDVEYWDLMLQEVVLQRAKADLKAYHVSCLQQLLDLLSQLRTAGILQEAIEEAERKQAASQQAPVTADALAVEKYLREVEKDQDFEDSELKMLESDEFALPSTVYNWEDKYRPRKPRYFNRVKTGWDRNKYNVTHYDHDNPPPKMIQGYKFTIFYPDLIDKTRTPKYHIEACPDCENNEFVIIRFHAGPPYEDLAFKILNKEWDRNKRAGFVNVFDRGILQLNFNFKRAFYRR